MIALLLKRVREKQRLDNFLAPADQVEEFESAEEIETYFDDLVNDKWFRYERESFHLRNDFAERLEEIATERQKAKDVFLKSAITERDAEKALEVFDGLQEIVQAGFADAPGQCCESKESAL